MYGYTGQVRGYRQDYGLMDSLYRDGDATFTKIPMLKVTGIEK